MYRFEQKEWMMKVALSHLNRPYIWGGDDPSGFDCSGLTIECLQSVGILPINTDFTAHGLFKKFEKHLSEDGAGEGDLLFWLKNDRAYHVAIALNWQLCITADKGGSHIKTLDDAIKHNAFVKVRPITHRKDAPKIIKLF